MAGAETEARFIAPRVFIRYYALDSSLLYLSIDRLLLLNVYQKERKRIQHPPPSFLRISSTENFSSDSFIGRIRIEGSLCLKEIRGAEHGNSGIAWILKKGGGGI